ncbi:fatty acid desaturase [Alteromonas sp. M12]|uniref:fatty acid desaturase n=1 Tax=Alteromonas sp. M12 TaxID=3135644 RepID=UPI00319E2330
MKNHLGRPIVVPPDKKAAFSKLTRIPEYSWPAVMLAVFVVGAVIAVDVLALSGYILLPIACIVLSFIYYWFFSVMHDSVHRSISKDKKLNDLIGQIVTSIYAPYASLELFRWAHMEHHRFTNDEADDPDHYVHGAWWSLPFRWMTIDIYYVYRLMINDKPQAKGVLKQSLPYMVIGILIVVGLIASGYGVEYFWLWFLPSRLAFIGIGFSFFWLPHSHWPNKDYELRQSENYTIATAVRLGKEWILNPLLQYQNYHLIHHLWPTTPFYNNQRVWKLLEPELRLRDLAVANDFQLVADIEFSKNASAEKSTTDTRGVTS